MLNDDLGGALSPMAPDDFDDEVLEYIGEKAPDRLIYVSGPMTNEVDFNRPAFEDLRSYIESDHGYKAIIPGDG